MESLRKRIAASRALTTWSILPIIFAGSMAGDGVERVMGATGARGTAIDIVVTAIVLGLWLAWIDGPRRRRPRGEESRSSSSRS